MSDQPTKERMCNKPQARIPTKLLVRLYAGHVKVAEVEDHALWLQVLGSLKSIELYDESLERLRLEAEGLTKERKLLQDAIAEKRKLDRGNG